MDRIRIVQWVTIEEPPPEPSVDIEPPFPETQEAGSIITYTPPTPSPRRGRTRRERVVESFNPDEIFFIEVGSPSRDENGDLIDDETMVFWDWILQCKDFKGLQRLFNEFFREIMKVTADLTNNGESAIQMESGNSTTEESGSGEVQDGSETSERELTEVMINFDAGTPLIEE